MAQSSDEQLTFIMTCLKHTPEKAKPNFDEVAKELGLSAKTCYHRHWSMLKKWGMTGSKAADAGSAVVATTAPATPIGRAKRGRPKSAGSKKKGKVADGGDDLNDNAADDDEESPSKKVKIDGDGDVKKEREIDDDVDELAED